jgi:hypothetical protein
VQVEEGRDGRAEDVGVEEAGAETEAGEGKREVGFILLRRLVMEVN